MKNNKNLSIIITAVLSSLISIWALFSTSLHNNATPFKLMEKLGIYASDSGFAYGITDKSFSFNGIHEIYVSLIKALAVNNVVNALIPMVIMSIILVCVLVYTIKSVSKTNYQITTIICSALLPIVFCDFTNMVYFKGLFVNPIILILLLLINALFFNCYKNNKASILSIASIFIATLIYSLIGVIQALTSVFFGILIIMLVRLCKSKVQKILPVIMGIIIILQSLIFTASFKDIDYNRSLYNSVFYGVCKYDNVQELGLDKELNDFKEIYFETKDNEAEYDLENNFYKKISYRDVLIYYIKNPANLIKTVNNELKAAFFYDNEYKFTPYSTLKMLYVPSNLLIVLLFAAVYIIISVFVIKKHKALKCAAIHMIMLSLMLIVSAFSTAIYYGNCDITANMYTFNIIFDILIVSAIIGGSRIMLKQRDEKKKQFGITRE